MAGISPIVPSAVDPNALRASLSHAQATKKDKIEQAGVQFEAIMLRQFLNDALKPSSIKGSLEEEGSGNDTYRYFVTDTLAQSMARQGVFGIGKQVTQQLLSIASKAGDPAAVQAAPGATPAPTSGTADAIKTKRL